MSLRLLKGMNKVNVLKSHAFPSAISSHHMSNESWVPAEKKTHTGQLANALVVLSSTTEDGEIEQWEEDDYRLARFIDRPKQINTQFAIDLIAAVPPMPTKERVICCDGGGGPTGHPKVFINLVSSSPNTPTSTTQRSRSPTTTTKSS
uniref:Zinc finger CHCC-type domain-containing protein n=1 Tax=Timema genevievae TaxID=629358 RepID=A0A7R9JSP8_TIMGE|nr:unnamed protein product [Timema genevievae]